MTSPLLTHSLLLNACPTDCLSTSNCSPTSDCLSTFDCQSSSNDVSNSNALPTDTETSCVPKEEIDEGTLEKY